MIDWERCPRLPIRPRRWINMVRAALRQWFGPQRRSLSVIGHDPG
jgi:hypothetical protein